MQQQQKIQYLGINLAKEIKELYVEDYRILKKGIEEEDTNKWKQYHVNGLEELMLKCPHYPKQFIDSAQFLLKYQ